MKELQEMRRKYLNLKQFYREPAEFVSGDKAPGHEGWKVEIALDKNDPEAYSVLCYTNSGENPNDQLETFYESCAAGVSGNIIIGQDYEIPYEAYLTKNGTTQEIYEALLTPGLRQNIGIRASNSLMNIQKVFKGLITVSSVTSAPNVGMKITGSIKHFSGGVTETKIDEDDIFVEAEGTITPGTPTDTTIPLTYDLTLNSASASDIKLIISKGGTLVETVSAIAGTSQSCTFEDLTPETEYTITLTNQTTSEQLDSVLVTTEATV